MKFSRILLFGIVGVSLVGPGISAANAAAPPGDGVKGKKDAPKGTKKPTTKPSTVPDRKVRDRARPPTMPRAEALEALVVVGRIQKPEVFYVLGRTDFKYRGLQLKKSFVDRIQRSIDGNPF